MNQQRPEPHGPTEGPTGAEVHSITAAHTPHSVDQSARVRRYLISMMIRTACVVCAVLVGGPLRWVFIAGAVVLPYVAVVMANAAGSGQRRATGGPQPVRMVALPRDADGRGTEGGGEAANPGRRSAEWVDVRNTSSEV